MMVFPVVVVRVVVQVFRKKIEISLYIQRRSEETYCRIYGGIIMFLYNCNSSQSHTIFPRFQSMFLPVRMLNSP